MAGWEVELAQDLQGEAVAATGGDDDLNTSGVSEREGSAVAWRDVAAGMEECAIEVDGNEAWVDAFFHSCAAGPPHPPAPSTFQNIDCKRFRYRYTAKIFFLKGLRSKYVEQKS